MEFNAKTELTRFDMNWMNAERIEEVVLNDLSKAIAKEIVEKYKSNIVLKPTTNNVEYSLKLYCSVVDKPKIKFKEKEGTSLDE